MGDTLDWLSPSRGATHRQTTIHSHTLTSQSTEHHLSGQSSQTFSCAAWEPTRAEEEEARSRFKLTTLFLWGNDAQHCTTTLHIFRSTSCPVLWSSEITSPRHCLSVPLSHTPRTHTHPHRIYYSISAFSKRFEEKNDTAWYCSVSISFFVFFKGWLSCRGWPVSVHI